MKGKPRAAIWLVLLTMGCMNVAWGALPGTFACNGCDLATMRDMANSLGEGNHYIYNLETGQLTFWHTSMVKVGERKFPSTRQLEVPPAAEKYWHKLLRLSKAAGTNSVHMTVTYEDLAKHSRSATTSGDTQEHREKPSAKESGSN